MMVMAMMVVAMVTAIVSSYTLRLLLAEDATQNWLHQIVQPHQEPHIAVPLLHRSTSLSTITITITHPMTQ